MRWITYFKHRRNKILAISFLIIAIACFLARVVFYYIGYGKISPISFNSLLTIIYFIFEGGILAFLLVCNINNDPRAYMAILMWVFWFVIDEIQTLLYSYSFLNVLGSNIGFARATLAIAQPAFSVACLALGIILYINIRRYMFGTMGNFKVLRYLAIAYTAVCALSYGVELGLEIVIGVEIGLMDIFAVSAIVLADIAIIFTLERLRR